MQVAASTQDSVRSEDCDEISSGPGACWRQISSGYFSTHSGSTRWHHGCSESGSLDVSTSPEGVRGQSWKRSIASPSVTGRVGSLNGELAAISQPIGRTLALRSLTRLL